MLSDAKARTAKPADKAYKLSDAGGLFLFVTPAGSKLWRLKYRLSGQEKVLSIGPYPDVSLSAARDHREAAKAILRNGRDPAVQRKLDHAARSAPETTFEAIARDWHTRTKPAWKGQHADDVIESLERHVFEALGQVQIAEITPQAVLKVLRVIEARPAIETAKRVHSRMSAVFVHAIASGLCNADPAQVVQKALAPLVKGRQPAVTNLEGARTILRTTEGMNASPVTKLALRLLALTSVRPGELRAARWEEFQGLDGADPLWVIPAERMKMKREHVVPLTPQAVATIAAVRQLTGRGPLPFPNARWMHRPMSENAMGYLMNRAGYRGEHVPHGWRATFSTVMNETFPSDRPIIDLMLAHLPSDKTEAAYNRALHMKRRRELAQLWADMMMTGMVPATALLEGRRK